MNEMTQALFTGELSKAKYQLWLVRQDDRTVWEEESYANHRAKDEVPDFTLGAGLTLLTALWGYSLVRFVILDWRAGNWDWFTVIGALLATGIVFGVFFFVYVPNLWRWCRWKTVAAVCSQETAKRKRVDREARFADAVGEAKVRRGKGE